MENKTNFLKSNQKKEIRKTISEEIILYEPTKDQIQEIKNLLNNQNLESDKELNVTGNINYATIRYMIRELCSNGAFIDEYTDDEITVEFDNGNKIIKELEFEMINLLNEIIEEMQMSELQNIKLINSMLNLINSELDSVKLQEKMNKLLKKQGVNLTTQELIDNKDNPEKMKELIDNSKKKYARKIKSKK